MSILKKDLQKFYMSVSDAGNADESHGDMAYFHDASPAGWFICQDYSGLSLPIMNDNIILGRDSDIFWHRQTVYGDGISSGGIMPSPYTVDSQILSEELVILKGTLYTSDEAHKVTYENIENLDKISPITVNSNTILEKYTAGIEVIAGQLVIIGNVLNTVIDTHIPTIDDVINRDRIKPITDRIGLQVISPREYTEGSDYSEDEMVVLNSRLYTTNAHTATAELIINKENLFPLSVDAPDVLNVPRTYIVGDSYSEGELVTLNESIYLASEHVATADNVVKLDAITEVGSNNGTDNLVPRTYFNNMVLDAGEVFRYLGNLYYSPLGSLVTDKWSDISDDVILIAQVPTSPVLAFELAMNDYYTVQKAGAYDIDYGIELGLKAGQSVTLSLNNSIFTTIDSKTDLSTLESKIGLNPNDVIGYSTTSNWAQVDLSGTGKPVFSEIFSFDAENDHVVVSDTGLSQIWMRGPSGNWSDIGNETGTPDWRFVSDVSIENGIVTVVDLSLVQIWERSVDGNWSNIGTGNGAPTWSRLFSISRYNGKLVAVDQSFRQIWERSVDGNWSNIGTGNGAPTWYNMEKIRIHEGRIIVTDSGLRQIWERSVDGNWSNIGTGNGAPTWYRPSGIGIDKDRFVITDSYSNEVWQNENGIWTNISFENNAPSWKEPSGACIRNGDLFILDKNYEFLWMLPVESEAKITAYTIPSEFHAPTTEIVFGITEIRNPTSTDDSNSIEHKITLNQFWHNSSTGEMFVCTDPTVGSAIWRQYITADNLPGSSANPLNIINDNDLQLTDSMAGPGNYLRVTGEIILPAILSPGTTWTIRYSGAINQSLNLNGNIASPGSVTGISPGSLITIICIDYNIVDVIGVIP